MAPLSRVFGKGKGKGPPGPPPTAPLPPIPESPQESAWEDSSEDDEPARPQTAIHSPTQSLAVVMELNMKISQENLLRNFAADPSPNELKSLKGLLSQMYHAYLSFKVPGGSIETRVQTGDDMRALFDEKMKNETYYELYYRYRKINKKEEQSFKSSRGLPRRMHRELIREWDSLVTQGKERKEDGHLKSVRFLMVVGSFLERFMREWKPKIALPGKFKKTDGGTTTPKASSSKTK